MLLYCWHCKLQKEPSGTAAAEGDADTDEAADGEWMDELRLLRKAAKAAAATAAAEPTEVDSDDDSAASGAASQERDEQQKHEPEAGISAKQL